MRRRGRGRGQLIPWAWTSVEQLVGITVRIDALDLSCDVWTILDGDVLLVRGKLDDEDKPTANGILVSTTWLVEHCTKMPRHKASCEAP